MRSRARFAGHAVHPMLIVFPLGLFVTAVVFDAIHLLSDSANFAVAGAYTTAAGVIGALVAALFGWVDWFSIPAGTRAKRIGLVHGLGNMVVLVLFAVSWLLRLDRVSWEPTVTSFVIALAALAVSGVTAWQGGELVERLGVSVDEDAGLDADSSLKRSVSRPARTDPAAGHG
ncbi:DUF2231 domain-containing protein [Actinophytocola gossypii]|uniref:DUF2231 domain-containing protein n=1 Tax=Actinophytocola gossypii TaxID=2812003 RepID=A0ABT2J6Z3_9PSEU|nr:DUF2231 domain-containing protein [Actinophytocola gossypii]MCT2583546.1 DUF2231 domain-containing protein [Actinophytocola gossypii]